MLKHRALDAHSEVIFDSSRGNSRLAPARRWGADDAPECAVEGRLGLVTDTSSNFSEPEWTFTQQSSCKLHPPAAEILHRRFADQLNKAFCQRGSRHGCALGEFLLNARGRAIQIAGHLRRDDYRGGDAVQLIIDDAAPAPPSSI